MCMNENDPLVRRAAKMVRWFKDDGEPATGDVVIEYHRAQTNSSPSPLLSKGCLPVVLRLP